MDFFKQILQHFPDGKVTITIMNKGAKQTIGYFADNKMMQFVSGADEGIDQMFFDHIAANKDKAVEIKKTTKPAAQEAKKPEKHNTAKAASKAKQKLTPKPAKDAKPASEWMQPTFF